MLAVQVQLMTNYDCLFSNKRITRPHSKGHLAPLLIYADYHISGLFPRQAVGYSASGCIVATRILDVSLTAAFLQKFGGIRLILEADIVMAKRCYEIILEYLTPQGALRHIGNYLMRLG